MILRWKKCPRKIVLPDLTTDVEKIPKIDINSLKEFTGKYKIQPGTDIALLIDSGKLIAVSPDNEKFQLYPASENKFFADMADLLLTFNKMTKVVLIV